MSNDPNPFQFSGNAGANKHRRSYVGTVVGAVFVIALIGVIVYACQNLEQLGRYAGKTTIEQVDYKDVVYDYSDNHSLADQKYKNHWLEVSGECSEPRQVQRPDLHLTEVLNYGLGKERSTFGDNYLVDCYVAKQNEKAFEKVTGAGLLTVRGRCTGKKGNAIELVDCEIVSYIP